MAQNGGGDDTKAANEGGGGGGGAKNAGGGTKVEEVKPAPQPVKEQLPGIQYCINSPPPWR
jgi:hypothetical protein